MRNNKLMILMKVLCVILMPLLIASCSNPSGIDRVPTYEEALQSFVDKKGSMKGGQNNKKPEKPNNFAEIGVSTLTCGETTINIEPNINVNNKTFDYAWYAEAYTGYDNKTYKLISYYFSQTKGDEENFESLYYYYDTDTCEKRYSRSSTSTYSISNANVYTSTDVLTDLKTNTVIDSYEGSCAPDISDDKRQNCSSTSREEIFETEFTYTQENNDIEGVFELLNLNGNVYYTQKNNWYACFKIVNGGGKGNSESMQIVYPVELVAKLFNQTVTVYGTFTETESESESESESSDEMPLMDVYASRADETAKKDPVARIVFGENMAMTVYMYDAKGVLSSNALTK